MADRKQLQENYENALFALLMDEVATAEGKRAIEKNKRLRQDPNVTLPEGMERRNLKAIRAYFTRKRAKTAGRYAVKGLARLMTVVGIIAVLFTTAFATSETVRLTTLNLVIEVYGDRTTLQYAPSNSPSSGFEFTLNWLPPDFLLTDQGANNTSIWQIYENANGDFIRISCTEGNGTTFGVDTEDANEQRTEINGSQALISQENGDTELVWSADGGKRFFVLISNLAELDDLLHVAQEISS